MARLVSTSFLSLTLGLVSSGAYAQQAAPKAPRHLPKPFVAVPERAPFNALRLGPNNTFSVAKTPEDQNLISFEISPNGSAIALGWESGRIEIWELPARKKTTEFKAGLGVPFVVQFNSSGDRLLIAGPKGKMSFFGLPEGKKLRQMTVAQGKRKYDIQVVVLDAEGKWLAYANGDNGKVLDLTTDPPNPVADLADAGSLALSRDGSELWTVNRRILTRFSTKTWQATGQWPLKSEPINTSPVVVRTGVTEDGGRSVAVPSKAGLVIYREPEMSGDYATDRPTVAVAVAQGGRLFVDVSRQMSFLKATGEALCSWSYEGRTDQSINDEGQWLALSQPGRVDLWRIEDLLRDCAEP